MATPPTVRAAGFFAARRAGTPIGEATVRMRNATAGTLTLDGQTYSLAGDVAKKKLTGTRSGSIVDLKINNRRELSGKVDGDALELSRIVLPSIPAAEMAQSDAGPSGSIQAVMDATPDYQAEMGDSTTFWYAFGPVLYRGRLDGSARVIGIASDPGPAECLPFARRALIGDSGQKTQGFFRKLGLTRSYVLVNGFAVALRPSQKSKGLKALKENANIRAARHGLYNGLLAGGAVEAIVAFGDVAHQAYDLWAASNSAVAAVPVFKLAHPAAVDREGTGNDAALKAWANAVTALRGVVTPDADGDPTEENFADYFTELDYARIPRWDLPAVAPAYIGDDSWGRAATPQHNNCCKRPTPDDMQSLLLTPAPGHGEFLHYRYQGGALAGAKNKDGADVSVNAFGIPT
jgi:hypothetical protein